MAQLGDNFIAINADVTNLADLERVFTETYERFVPAEQIEGLKTQFASAMPTDRIRQPSDISKTAVFLASDDAAWITGEQISVSGGMYGF